MKKLAYDPAFLSALVMIILIGLFSLQGPPIAPGQNKL